MRIAVVSVIAVLSLAACDFAGAATVTLGSPSLATGSKLSGCGSSGPCTFLALSLPQGGGGLVRSPVRGAIVRWRIKAGSALSGYAIRVLRQQDGLEFTGAGTSLSVTPSSGAIEEFAANLPIEVGDYVGLNVPEDGTIWINEAPGAAFGFFLPMLADGATGTTGSFPSEVAFNADVQPAPTITGLGPNSGPTTGGTVVNISGADFTGVTGVSFGDAPAAGFSVGSEGALTAISPPGAATGLVPVQVTTNAGASVATGNTVFEYTQPPAPPAVPRKCLVPGLRGKTLRAARRIVRRAGCAIGRVKLRGATTKSTGIVRQVPRAGRLVPAGKKITVTLGEDPRGS